MLEKQTKEQIRAKQQILHLMVNIADLYPQYTMSQHMIHILRKKTFKTDSYEWDDVTFLKRIEDYYDELRNDLN